MNTRLQVEHPVTECITGLDLVELMIRVAAGEKLPFTQADIKRSGWAIECRINAEDPFRGFLPSTGRLVQFRRREPTIDGRRQPGGRRRARRHRRLRRRRDPVYYDSMIAKLIVHGTDRVDAIARMREALNAFVIRGVCTNIPFQAALLAHPQFVSGEFNTGFIAEHYPSGFKAAEHGRRRHRDSWSALAATIHRRMRERAVRISGQLPGHEVRVADELRRAARARPAHTRCSVTPTPAATR